jgi:hypothetical protein
MLISIFPKAKAHPKKDEKQSESKKCSTPFEPEVREVFTEDDLIEIVTKYAWSPSIFRKLRRMDNFIKADFMALDIDNGLTIDEAEIRVHTNKLTALALPSPSHTPEAHRFRLIFPLAKSIYNKETFDATWEKLSEIFPELDKQCSDCCRFYFGSTMDEGFWFEAEFLEPETPKIAHEHISREVISTEDFDDKDILSFIYGEVPEVIPEAVAFFLANAHTGLEDHGWTMPLNACCFTLALQGIEDGIIYSVIEKVAPDKLDNRDLDTIERAINDGIKASS